MSRARKPPVKKGWKEKLESETVTPLSNPRLFDALTIPAGVENKHSVNPGIYRRPSEPPQYDLEWTFRTKVSGKVREFKISYTTMGDRGPLVVFLHGVPTNKRQWYPVQRMIAPFARTLSFDMLGMGASSKPLDLPAEYWDWKYDCVYIKEMIDALFPDKVEPYVFVADDWGGGILATFTSLYGADVSMQVLVDPIAFDGYPVNEIQAIGRASQIKDQAAFEAAMGAFDQTLVQIYKTMVYEPSAVYNQYSLRDITFPYVLNNYEDPSANSLTLKLDFDAIRVLANRAARLAPAQLLPYESERNPRGIDYGAFRGKTVLIWGKQDNMMPAEQVHRFANAYRESNVSVHQVDNAGHFVSTDRPARVAEIIIDEMRQRFGPDSLGDIFLGYSGIWKGDEAEMIAKFRDIWIV